MIFITTLLATDFGKMRKYEKACESGNYKYEEVEETKAESNNTGKVIDLILPIVFLIGASIVSMLYTGACLMVEYQLLQHLQIVMQLMVLQWVQLILLYLLLYYICQERL